MQGYEKQQQLSTTAALLSTLACPCCVRLAYPAHVNLLSCQLTLHLQLAGRQCALLENLELLQRCSDYRVGRQWRRDRRGSAGGSAAAAAAEVATTAGGDHAAPEMLPLRILHTASPLAAHLLPVGLGLAVRGPSLLPPAPWPALAAAPARRQCGQYAPRRDTHRQAAAQALAQHRSVHRRNAPASGLSKEPRYAQ